MDIFDKCYAPDTGYFSHLRSQNDDYFISPKLEGAIGPRMKYNNKEVVVWSINSYLGIHQEPEFIQAAKSALQKHGTESPMGSRLMSGNSDLHLQLEKELAEFVGKENSNLFANGYLGIIGIIGALVGENDYVVADRQCHACLIDGMKLASSPGKFRIYLHNDMNDLERVLASVRKSHQGGILILTEGVFGMSGEIAKLDAMCALKEKYHARVLVDDAHGFGVIGDTGRGVGEHLNIMDKIDIYFSTFAKAFAGIGSFSAASDAVNQYIKFNARSNIFTKALPAIYASTALASLNVLKTKGQTLLKSLRQNTHELQTGLRELGYDLGQANAQITPVYLPLDIRLCSEIVKSLREKYGIFVSAVSYPVVPKNTLLLRLIPTSLHTHEDIESTLDSFKKTKKEFNL